MPSPPPFRVIRDKTLASFERSKKTDRDPHAAPSRNGPTKAHSLRPNIASGYVMTIAIQEAS